MLTEPLWSYREGREVRTRDVRVDEEGSDEFLRFFSLDETPSLRLISLSSKP
jgi:hypothetical protein